MAKSGMSNWVKNFGKAASYASANVVTGLAPNTADIIRSGRDTITETRRSIVENKGVMNSLNNQIQRTTIGKQSKKAFEMALKDIKSGTFGMERVQKDMSDLDWELPEIDPELEAGGTFDLEIAEFNKDVTITSTMAVIESQKQSAAMIGNTTINSMKGLSQSINNTMITAMNRINQNQMQANNYLANIDANIANLITFQNESTSVVNQATLNFMEETRESFEEMFSLVKEMRNNEPKRGKRISSGDYLFRGSMDIRGYKDYLKENIDSIFPFFSLAKDFAPIAGESVMGSGTPLAMRMMQMAMKQFIPKGIRNGVGKIDSNLPKYTRHLLMKMGNWENDPNSGFLKMVMGSIFGIKSPEIKALKLGNYKKGATTFDGTTKRAIEEVIPDLLSKSNMYLAKLAGDKSAEKEYYNYDKGEFISESKLKSKYTEDVRDTALRGMSASVTSINDAIKEMNFGNMSDKEMKTLVAEMQTGISKIFTNNMTNGSKVGLKNSAQIQKFLQGAIQNKSIAYINKLFSEMDVEKIMGIEDEIFDTKISMKDFMDSISDGMGENAAYRNLFNRDKKKSKMMTKEAINSTNFFSDLDILREREAKNLTDRDRRLQKANEKINDTKDSLKDKMNKRGMTAFNEKVESMFDRLDQTLYRFADGQIGGKDILNGAKRTKDNVANRVKTRHTRRRRNSGQENTNTHGGMLKPGDNIDSYEKSLFTTTQSLASSLSAPMSARDSISLDDGNENMQVMADIYERTADVVQEASEKQTKSFGGLVYGLYSTYLKPSFDMVFGKDGLIGKYILNDRTKEVAIKIKKYLFGEKNADNNNAYENGILSGVANKFMDAADYIKYAFTGKGYTNREGKSYADTDNSVLGFLGNGLEKFSDLFMQFVYGDDYHNNENFKKSPFAKIENWWNTKRGRNRKEAEDDTLKTKESKNSLDKKDNTAKYNTYQIPYQKFNPKELKMSTNDLMGLPNEPQFRSKNRNARGQLLLGYDNDEEPAPKGQLNGYVKTTETADAIIIEGAYNAKSEIENIGHTLSEVTVGEDANEPEKFKKSFSQKFKAGLPKVLLGGVLGAATIGLSGGSLGLLGSLFLPSGILGGAIVGSGIALASQSEKFQKFMFGDKDENGERKGGLINKKLQEAFKKSLPIMAGGAVLGVLKNAVGFGGGPVGMMASTLLPGGIIGGALLGMGTSLITRNTTFQKIVFGEKDDDGKRQGGALSKAMNKGSAIIQKSANFIAGGIKGAAIGGLTAGIVSKMGILGAALTPFGPIGGALVGAGIGIASQTERFKKLLFGEKDEETGKRQGGLITKAANMINIHLIEPAQVWAKDMMVETAATIRENITKPIKAIFRPIGNTMQEVKQNIEDSVHKAFESIANGVTNIFEKTLAPIGNFFVKWILSPIGKTAGFMLKSSVKTTAGMIGAPLKLAANIMNFKRTKNNLKTKWAERNGSGMKEVFAKGLDIINLANPFADTRTEEEIAEDQMVEDERQKVRNEKKLLRLRQQYQRQDKYSERTLSEKEFLKRRKAFLRMGIREEDLQSQQDLNNFIYRNNLKSTNENDILKASKETSEYQDTVKTKINDISENLRKIVKGETKGAEILNETVNPDDLLRKLYGDNDISKFKTDEVIDVDYEVDSSYAKQFRGRNDLRPKEIEMISNTAEAVEAGMTQASINNEKRSLTDKFKEKIQGLSFLSKKEKEDEGDAQILQLEGEKEEGTKTGGLVSKIFGSIGGALGNIGTFIVKHPVISAGIGAALGTVLYDSLKSSGLWDKVVVPVMDKLKDTVAEGIAAGWQLIKQGGSNAVQSFNESAGKAVATVFGWRDDGTFETKKKSIEGVASDYIMSWNSSESKAKSKLNSVRKKMEEAGYTNSQINEYIEKLDQTRNIFINGGRFLPNVVTYEKYELTTTPESSNVTSIGNGKKSIGRGKNKASAIIPHMSQNDARWSNQVIGNRNDGTVSTISNGGCGMTSLAMIANSLGRKTNPSEVAALASGYGYTADGGSTEDLFTKGSAQLGLSTHRINKGNLVNALASGKPVIIAGKSNDGVFSKEGHIIAASGLDKNGNAWVDDPENNGKTKVSVNKLLSGMTHAWDFTKGPKRASIGTALNNIGRANIKLINGAVIKDDVINGSSSTQPQYVSEDIIKNLKAKGIDTSLMEKNNAQIKANQSTSKTNTQKTSSIWNLFGNKNKNTATTATTSTNKSIGVTGSPDGSYVLSDGSTVEIKNGAVYYNQADDRWANVSMGGGTIKSIGCVLSSFAMGLASLLNKDYNPAVTYDTFRSAFTSGGAIRWDDFASQVGSRLGVSIKSETSNSAVSQLKKNIPVVLFGNRVSGGLYGPPGSSTHCVLGISSDGDGVVINDPGFRSNSESKHSITQLKTGFLKAYSMSLGGKGINGVDSSLFSTMNYASGDTPGGGQSTGLLSGIASWLTPLFKPLQQLGAVMMNKMHSLLTGEEYQSVFDGSGNYVGSLFGDILSGLTGSSGSSYQSGNFSDAANAYSGGKWDANKLRDQDLKLYGPDSITAEDLNGWVQAKSPNSFWRDKGSVIMEASRRTGLDPRYILSHAVHETGWTVSKIAQDKNNFFGIGAFDASPYASAYNWNGVEAGIIGGAEWINDHYYESKYHQNTIRKMRWNNGVHEYATDPGWDQKIAGIWSGAPGVKTNKQYTASTNNVFTQNKAANELANNALTNSWVKQSLQNKYPEIYGNTQLNNGVNLKANTTSNVLTNPSNSARMKLYNTALKQNNLGYGKKGTGTMLGYKKTQTSKPENESKSMDKQYKELNNIFAKTSKVVGLGKKLGYGISQKVVNKNTDDMMKTVKNNASGTVKKFNLNGIGQGKFQEKQKLQEVDRKLQVSLNSKDINTKLDTLIQVERDLAKAILSKGGESVTNVTNNYTNIGNGKTVEKTVVKQPNVKPQSNNSTLRRQHDLITRGIR